MNNSLILSFFIKLYNLFAAGYETSVFKKVCNLFKGFLIKSSKKSRFVAFFTKKSDGAYTEQSGFYLLIRRIYKYVRNIFSAIKKPFDSSLILSSVKNYYSNIMYYSVGLYGAFVLSALTSFSFLYAIKGGITVKTAVIMSVGAAMGIIMILINKSPAVLLSNSLILKKLLSLIGIDISESEITKHTPWQSYVVFVILGIISGVVSTYASPKYAIAFFVGIFFFCLVIYNYKTAVYMLPVILPFMPTMALVGLIILAFISFVIKMLSDKGFVFRKTPLDLFILAFAFITILTAFTSITPKKSIQIMMVYLVFMCAYFLITNTITSKKELYALLSVVMISAFFVGLYGIYQYVFGFDEGLVWIDSDMFSDIETRVVSTFENPNVLGEYLLLMIPIAVAFIWSAPKNFTKFIHLCVAGVLALCMIFTYSRGNWIGLIVAIALFFAFYDRKFIWFGLIVLMISPVFLPQNIINRFLSVGDTADTSTSYRVNIWFGTLKMLKEYWLTGIGQGEEAFTYIYSKYSYAGVTAPHSHNLYLQILTENGIMGIIIFLGMMITYFKNVISSVVYKEHSFLKAVILGLSAGMFGYLVQGLFDNVFYNYRLVLLFYIVLGLTGAAVNCYNLTKEDCNV